MLSRHPHAFRPRFWVSEQRAAGVVGKMLAGHDPTADMYEEKREMYREIFRRFMKLREERLRGEHISARV